MADNERRFTFKLDTTANLAGVSALTNAVKQQATSQTQLGGAVKATQQWVAGWNTTVNTAADGTRRWGDANRKTIAELMALKTAAAQASAAQAAADKSADLKAIGAKWSKESAGGRGAGLAAGAGAAAAAAGGGRDMGRAALEFSRAAEDAQYGIAGVLNNLPGLVMMLGGGAGLAGALSLAAVGATQLVKHLGGINAAVDPEILKAKLEAIKSLTDATMAKMSEDMNTRFESDLRAVQAKAEAALGNWKQTLANAEATKTQAEAGTKTTADSAQAALAAEVAGNKDPATLALQADRADAAKVTADRAKLTAESTAAKQAREAIEQGIKTAQQQRDAAESVNGPFGNAAADGKAAVVNKYFGAGIQSDQEKQINTHDRLKQERDDLVKFATRDEVKLGELTGTMVDAKRNWIQVAFLKKAVERRRTRIDALNPQVDAAAPGIEAARADMAAGNVSFNSTDEAKLTPQQKFVFAQGKAELEAQAATQAAARERAAKAQADIAAATAQLGPAQQREKDATAAHQNFELNRATGQLNAGQLPDLPPEMMGKLEAAARERGGLANEPRLPDAPNPVVSPGPGAFAPPDLSGHEQAFSGAMEQTSTAIHGTMDRVVGSSEKLAQAMGSMRSQYDAKLAALEQQIEALKTHR